MHLQKLHVNVTVNKNEQEFLCDPEDTLLDVLRNDLQLTGTKEGCIIFMFVVHAVLF